MRNALWLIVFSALLFAIPKIGILEMFLGPLPVSIGWKLSVQATHGPVDLHVETTGRGSPAIVLIHGFSGSTYSWHQLAPKLARTNTVVAVDLMGFGQSQKPEGASYSLDEQAGLVAAMIAKLNLTDVTLVGSSLGGNVALRAARRAPANVARIVLIGVPSAPQALDAVRRAAAAFWAIELLVRYLPPELLIAYTSRRLYPMSTWPELNQIRIHGDVLRRPGGPAALLNTLRGLINDLNGPDSTPDIPMLLVWCDDDTFVTVEQARDHQRSLRAAKLITLRDCAHAPHYLNSSDIAREIAVFHTE